MKETAKNPFSVILGEVLKSLRKNGGKTNDAIANELEVSYYRMIEGGSVNFPIAKVLDLIEIDCFKGIKVDKLLKFIYCIHYLGQKSNSTKVATKDSLGDKFQKLKIKLKNDGFILDLFDYIVLDENDFFKIDIKAFDDTLEYLTNDETSQAKTDLKDRLEILKNRSQGLYRYFSKSYLKLIEGKINSIPSESELEEIINDLEDSIDNYEKLNLDLTQADNSMVRFLKDENTSSKIIKFSCFVSNYENLKDGDIVKKYSFLWENIWKVNNFEKVEYLINCDNIGLEQTKIISVVKEFKEILSSIYLSKNNDTEVFENCFKEKIDFRIISGEELLLHSISFVIDNEKEKNEILNDKDLKKSIELWIYFSNNLNDSDSTRAFISIPTQLKSLDNKAFYTTKEVDLSIEKTNEMKNKFGEIFNNSFNISNSI